MHLILGGPYPLGITPLADHICGQALAHPGYGSDPGDDVVGDEFAEPVAAVVRQTVRDRVIEVARPQLAQGGLLSPAAGPDNGVEIGVRKYSEATRRLSANRESISCLVRALICPSVLQR